MRLLPLLAATVFLVLAPPPGLAEPGGGQTSVDRLTREIEQWLDALSPERELHAGRERWLEDRVDELVAAGAAEPERWRAVWGTLLDVAGYRLTRAPDASFFRGGAPVYRVRAIGLEALRRLAGGPRRDALVDFLVRGVVAEPETQPVHRRRVALFLVRDEHSPVVDRALLSSARVEEDPLRGAALDALGERSGPEVDLFLVEQLDGPRRDPELPHPFNLVRRRLDNGPLDPEAAGLLVRKVKSLLLSSDWRDASRGIELTDELDPMRVAPMLVEALYAWQGRGADTAGTRRTTWELVRELQRLSGKAIGDNAKSWTTWWRAVRDGTVALPARRADEAAAVDAASRPESSATFFGLQPATDRVTFVIDHSGSMLSPWDASGRTRYEEAIEQLMRFLQGAGEGTRFNIVLFATEPLMSTPHLVEATPENLERARASLARRRPDGWTDLRRAVEHALRLDPSGHADPEHMQADTIIVLCDGETAHGPSWVRPLLDRVGAELRVVFHCAQIGGSSDGTLELLARLTGGEFVRVRR